MLNFIYVTEAGRAVETRINVDHIVSYEPYGRNTVIRFNGRAITVNESIDQIDNMINSVNNREKDYMNYIIHNLKGD